MVSAIVPVDFIMVTEICYIIFIVLHGEQGRSDGGKEAGKEKGRGGEKTRQASPLYSTAHALGCEQWSKGVRWRDRAEEEWVRRGGRKGRG